MKSIEITALTDIGRKREENQDNFVGLSSPAGNEHQVLIGAIDGVGGYAGGAEAALIVRETLEYWFREGTKDHDDYALLRKAIVDANNKIVAARHANQAVYLMSCVASVVLADYGEELLYYAHCGDSRTYILRGGELSKITKDHSLVGALEDNGDLKEEDALNHPRRNEIFKMLGEKELNLDTEYIDFGEYSFYPGDILLCCSDGLTDLVRRAEIAEILSWETGLKEKAQALIDKANEYGGKDNITVVLAEFASDEPKSERTDRPGGQEIHPVEEPAANSRKRKIRPPLYILIASLVIVMAVGAFLIWGKDTNIPAARHDKIKRPAYDYIDERPDDAGLRRVAKQGKWGFINKNEEIIIPLKYDSVLSFQKGYAEVMNNLLWGMIDTAGKETVPVEYDFIKRGPERNILVESKGNRGILDYQNDTLVPIKYQFIGPDYTGDLRPVVLNEKYGFIDSAGREVILPQYQAYKPFENGLAAVKKTGHWGFINKKGKLVIELKYDTVIASFNPTTGLAKVMQDGKQFFINEKGEKQKSKMAN